MRRLLHAAAEPIEKYLGAPHMRPGLADVRRASPCSRRDVLLLHIIALVAFAISLGDSLAQEGPAGKCELAVQPTVRVAPKLPPILHNDFEGHANIEFLITPTGDVQDARLVSAEWRPIGRSRGQPRGYDEAILKAVGDWKYEPVERPCRHTTRITFTFSERDPA